MTKPDNLFVIGSILPPPPATPLTYSLETGWNLLGFKPEPKVTSEQVGQYLSSINGKYDANSVWVYDNQSGTWIRADGSYTLQPGQAMWIMMTEPAALQP